MKSAFPIVSLMLPQRRGSEMSFLKLWHTKLLQKSEMRKDIVIELSYKGFS